MKKCPYCAEEIQDAAIVCRYCGRDLIKQPSPPQTVAPTQAVKIPWEPPAKKPSRTPISPVRGFIGLCVFFICIIAVMRTPGGTTPTQEQPTSTAELSSVVMFTFTPETSRTPRPTRTPAPTRTPTPPEDPYVAAFQEKIGDFMQAYFDAADYLDQASDNPSVILDSEWKRKTGLALGILNFRADELAALEPSPGFVTFHSYLIELAKETHLFTEAYAKGIDNIDADYITIATGHLSNMGTIMKNATAELEAIQR